MRRNATSWTDEEDDELWRLLGEGISRMRMSVRMRRTERAVQSRLTFLRKKNREPTLTPPVEQRASAD